MKLKRIALRGIGDAVPLACGMIACVSAVMTAYRIDYSPAPLILFCLFSALLLSFWMNAPKHGVAFAAVFLTSVFLLCVFRMKQIGNGAIVFAYRLMSELPKEIAGLFELDRLAAAAASVEEPNACITLFLMLAAAAIGFMLAFSLIRSKMVLLPLLIPLPMLLASLVYTNRPPALWTIVLLCLYFGYTLLGNGLRRGDYGARGRLTVILAPALLILAMVIMASFPQKSYTPIAPDVRNAIFSEQFGPIADAAMSWFGSKNPRSVDLSDEDERKEDDTELFTVYARNGAYLLRTHSYGLYGDNKWQAADRYKGKWQSMEALGKRQEQADAMMWIFDSISGERIVPYAWSSETDSGETAGTTSVGESVIRSGGWKDYSWRFTSRYRLKTGTVTKEERAYYDEFAMEQYVMPLGTEKEALLDVLNKAGITRSGDTLETARAVASFVRDSGEYTLTPGKVPKGKDFILYFLTESHKGYCVHFASATTALLQALEIPARYTVGYYAEIPEELSNKGMTVTQNDEHAWAEVYVLGLGWVPIESTPGRYEDREGYGSGHASAGQETTAPIEPTPAPTPVPPTQEPGSTPEPTPEPDVQEQPTPAVQTPPEDPSQDDTEHGKKHGGAWWLLFLPIPLLWTAAGLLVRKRREAVFRDPNVRRSIPEMAHYLDRLRRFGAAEDPDAMTWAIEAAFSDHRMEAEHRTLLKRVHAAQKALYADKPVLHFLFRWVLYLI